MSRLLGRGLLAAVVLLGAAPALAHPHAWIDVRTKLVFGDGGRIVALEQQWLFDDFYTAFVLDSLRKKGGAADKAIDGLARENLENLKPYGYFTEIYAGPDKVGMGTVTEYASEVRAKRLWLRFVLPLAAPVDPRQHRVSYSVFDPTYYIEMVHAKESAVALDGPGAAGCAARVDESRATPQEVARAAALDRFATPDESLGRLFAETVVLTCR